ncbi:MAG: tetratricopeptide repeat protein [Gammaproteobacteria bacterium]|nr:tetratricopeptide repeat protein [Gammaproteobacteria bacterium]
MYSLRITGLLILILSGTACNNLATKPDQEPTDLKDVATTQQRAKLAYDAGNWVNAEMHYLKLTRLVPGDAEPWFRLGNIYTRLNRPDDAIRAYQESIVRNPKNTKTWHNLGIVQLRQATNTFVQLQQYSDPGDPLNQRAGFVVNAMSQIMEKGFGVSGDETEQ